MRLQARGATYRLGEAERYVRQLVQGSVTETYDLDMYTVGVGASVDVLRGPVVVALGGEAGGLFDRLRLDQRVGAEPIPNTPSRRRGRSGYVGPLLNVTAALGPRLTVTGTARSFGLIDDVFRYPSVALGLSLRP